MFWFKITYEVKYTSDQSENALGLIIWLGKIDYKSS